jgi:hypothetical protein
MLMVSRSGKESDLTSDQVRLAQRSRIPESAHEVGRDVLPGVLENTGEPHE